MKGLGVKGYAVVAAALLIGLAATGGFATAAMSSQGGTYDTYDPVDDGPGDHDPIDDGPFDTNRADISFVSFCNLEGNPPAINDVTFEEQTVDGVTKEWQVSYDPPNAQFDYLILKGGSAQSPNGYIVKIDNPMSPVSVSDTDATFLAGVTFPGSFGPDNACLGNDVGVKFENEELQA
jgi:hypothetical protein